MNTCRSCAAKPARLCMVTLARNCNLRITTTAVFLILQMPYDIPSPHQFNMSSKAIVDILQSSKPRIPNTPQTFLSNQTLQHACGVQGRAGGWKSLREPKQFMQCRIEKLICCLLISNLNHARPHVKTAIASLPQRKKLPSNCEALQKQSVPVWPL